MSRAATAELPARCCITHAARSSTGLPRCWPACRWRRGSRWCGPIGAELGVGASTVVGHATTAFPALAAWINGSASHAAEFDDIFRDAVYHPGCPTIAAALALAEQADASGTDFLRAVIAGYEVSTRIGAAIQPAHYRYFHTTGTVGCLGAAAAGAAGGAAAMRAWPPTPWPPPRRSPPASSRRSAPMP